MSLPTQPKNTSHMADDQGKLVVADDRGNLVCDS
jgi:hypothetical protein